MMKMRRRNSRTRQISALTAAVLMSTTSVTQASQFFAGLGDLEGGIFSSQSEGISDDGLVVVGHSRSASGPYTTEAFRWTAETGMVGLGDLPDGRMFSGAFGASADGSVVVGFGETDFGREAFRWTSSTGMVGLGDLGSGSRTNSTAFDTSDDGSVVVGGGETDVVGSAPFRWTLGSGPVDLGVLPAGVGTGGFARGVSGDGSVVVGNAHRVSGGDQEVEAFRWTSSTGMVGLGDLPGGPFRSDAYAISNDGLVIVGQGETASGSEPFRWTASTGMIGLGLLPGEGNDGIAKATSADGSVVVGNSETDFGTEAFIWDETNGMRLLEDVFVAAGFDLTGWLLGSAQGISADGMVIAGVGNNPDGNIEAWIANLRSDAVPPPPTAPGGTGVVPIPAAFPLFATGLGIMGFVGWRRRKAA
jgi:probable HAF family extracellular repeat protein